MKNAVLVLIVDARGGMRFNNRRQMKDPVLIEKILAKYGGGRIFVAPMSAKLFQNINGVTVCDDPLGECTDDSMCFVESPSCLSGIEDMARIVIYSWGTSYPADEYFTLDMHEIGFRRISSEKLKTPSHDRITCDVYVHI